ncbi:MAG TPA: phosphoribosyltransferase family protein [Candidatus Saccharimonadales bacterium]|nr:phosphoribosyltransferase family protein [Candidatus Saccharimonadales bacterium]
MGVGLEGLELPRTIRTREGLFNTECVLPAEQIQRRVDQMGQELAERYSGRGAIHMLVVLNGAMHFASDLMRAAQRVNPDLDITADHVRASSYAGRQSSGVIRLQCTPSDSLADKHVLVVEDIVDSGLTLDWLIPSLRAHHPASLEVAAAVVKNNPARAENILGGTALHAGFELGNDFVIGYGLDIDQQYRHLDSVYKVTPVTADVLATAAL